MHSDVTDLEAQPRVADDDRAYTVREFCVLERMSHTTFHKLQKAGLGPAVLRFPGMAFVRITAAARREWHARIAALAQEQDAQLEKQRRSALKSRAGKAAAASPAHVSKRKSARR
jgi:hypothetical protein